MVDLPHRRLAAVIAATRQRIADTTASVRRVEGERGMALRWAVGMRYLSYLVGVIITAGIVGAYPPLGRLATTLVVISCVIIIVTAAIGTIAYPTERRALVDQMRFFVFGVVCFPSIVIGALLTVVDHFAAGAASVATGTSDGLIISLSKTALPYAFWGTVVVPPFLFVKTIVGLRKLHRDRMDDEESVALWTRQG